MVINLYKYLRRIFSSAGHSNRHFICRYNTNFIFGSVALSLVCLSGCGKHKSVQSKEALVDQLSVYGGPETAKLRVGGKTEDKAADIPGAVRGTGWHIPWYETDTQNPDRPPQRLLVADAQAGALDNDNDVATVHLTDVQATLYHSGKPSATLDAPHVTTNERDRVIIATGGVTIHSLISPRRTRQRAAVPANSTVTADKVVWDSHKTEVVCTGHARLVSKQPGSPTIESYSEKIIYDTATGDVDFRYNTPGK